MLSTLICDVKKCKIMYTITTCIWEVLNVDLPVAVILSKFKITFMRQFFFFSTNLT